MAEVKNGTRDEDGFARRWSRLKQESRVPEAAEPELEQTVAAEAPDAAAVEPIDPADLPDLDSLDANSDYTPFMRAGVPEELKRLALRKLWRTDPVFANLDGMNDYDEDFSAILKSGAAFMDKLAEAARSAADAGTDGPRYPTATYADADESEEIDDAETGMDVRPHSSGADSGVSDSAHTRDDSGATKA
jgi:hypothetical protein